tara:strand:+ start:1678 stop:2313 length:636 start_codon:yes stop_codon:yes gene_type:complete
MRRAHVTLAVGLFAGLALGDAHTTVTYAILSGDTRCESEGYADILTSAECETAATALSLPDTTDCASCPITNNNAYPNGCHAFGSGQELFTVLNDPPVSNDAASNAGSIAMLCKTSVAFDTCYTWYSFPESSLQKSANPAFQQHSWYEGCAYGFQVGGNQAACEALCDASNGCCTLNDFGWACASNSCSGGGCCAGMPSHTFPAPHTTPSR